MSRTFLRLADDTGQADFKEVRQRRDPDHRE
jgi:hypothetical protein